LQKGTTTDNATTEKIETNTSATVEPPRQFTGIKQRATRKCRKLITRLEPTKTLLTPAELI
jgi:hypothetical protein